MVFNETIPHTASQKNIYIDRWANTKSIVFKAKIFPYIILQTFFEFNEKSFTNSEILTIKHQRLHYSPKCIQMVLMCPYT